VFDSQAIYLLYLDRHIITPFFQSNARYRCCRFWRLQDLPIFVVNADHWKGDVGYEIFDIAQGCREYEGRQIHKLDVV